MIAALVLTPLLGGLLAALAGRGARLVTVITLLLGAVLTGVTWTTAPALDVPWIPALGVDLRLVLDGLSLPLVLLAWGLGLVAALTSDDIQAFPGFYHLNLLWVLAGVVGVFLAADLLVLFVCWELMLVPMYLLIGVWGHGDRVRAALRFFLFTQASGLLLLVAILALALAGRAATGALTFDPVALGELSLAPATQRWLFLGFFAAFAVKMPVFPLHTWLPDAHTEAPTGGSVILAGLLLKTGAYGLIRFAFPLFPEGATELAPALMVLGAIGILYGAWLAFAQHDAKRLVAYSSVSHMGFVLLAVAAWNEVALQGALLEMICHGLSTGGLFVVVGMVQRRLGTRDLRELGGLHATLPRLGTAGLFLALATLALPGTGNFVAEFLCLLGAWQAWPGITAVAAVGVILSAAYALWFVQQVFHGPLPTGVSGAPPDAPSDAVRVRDLGAREGLVCLGLAVALVWLGLAPQPVLDVAEPTIEALAPPEVLATTTDPTEGP